MNKNYIPLYRKYRPQRLEEIVGQEHIKKALSNAIETNRISHAYLFTGPRGTGKTSSARIFAKSLNCEKGPTITPCNKCENCQNITKSIPIDVIEIDAASNRSVNDAEEIIQNVAMAPVHSRYKIYIIDEVHMLTPTAFNALLKTLEEPPENVIFILATTEVHKVLDTIKSRCQRFDFKRITTEDISKHLRYISDCEKINITDEALNYIAQNSAGGMRDSIALLDQLSILNTSDSEIGVDDINKLLGRLSFDSLSALFTSISKSEQNKALEILNDIYNQGNEPSQILSNFLEFLRNALIIKSVNDINPESVVQLNKEQIQKVENIISEIETHQIVSLIDKCAGYIKELKLTTNPKLWIDVAILDMANLTQNTKLGELQKRIEQLENGNVSHQINVSPYNTPPSPVMKQEIKQPVQVKQTSPKEQIKKEDKNISSSTEKAPQQVQQSEQPQKNISDGGIKQLWDTFLSNISSFPSRTILKQQAIPIKLTEDEVIIAIKNPTWLKNFSPDGERFAFIQEAAKAVFSMEPKITIRAPQAGDDKIREESLSNSAPRQPQKTLIPESSTKIQEEEVFSDNDLDNDIDSEETNEDTEENKDSQSQTKISTIRASEAAYHSDNVNMVMDLFEGKIIE